MKIRHISVLLGALLVSNFAMAGGAEDRWNSLSEARQAEISEKAAARGYDLSTEAGRAEFRDARSAHRKHRSERRDRRREYLSTLSKEERTALREELAGLSREERREILKDRFGS